MSKPWGIFVQIMCASQKVQTLLSIMITIFWPRAELGKVLRLFVEIIEVKTNNIWNFPIFKDRGIDKEILPLGFTFSFPCRQKGLAVGELITWTKGIVYILEHYDLTHCLYRFLDDQKYTSFQFSISGL